MNEAWRDGRDPDTTALAWKLTKLLIWTVAVSGAIITVTMAAILAAVLWRAIL